MNGQEKILTYTRIKLFGGKWVLSFSFVSNALGLEKFLLSVVNNYGGHNRVMEPQKL